MNNIVSSYWKFQTKYSFIINIVKHVPAAAVLRVEQLGKKLYRNITLPKTFLKTKETLLEGRGGSSEINIINIK